LTEKIRGTRDEVRKFGILFAVVFSLIGLYTLYRGNGHWYVLVLVGLLFLVAGFIAYPLLRPVYLGWMKFAFVLGWINTRILLGLFFFLVVTPIGVGMRLFGKDLLDEKIEKSRKSYWQKREKTEFDPARVERLF
jgi:Saxitoxin biosynthesis operon protein SxtJ